MEAYKCEVSIIIISSWLTGYSLPLLDDTSCKPAKSPIVDEVAFQEPSPHVNNSSPEGKLVDGKEVPLAENGIWWFRVCMKMLSLTVVSQNCFDPAHCKSGNECGQPFERLLAL